MRINGHDTWQDDHGRMMIQAEALIPYERNPRHNKEAVPKVAESIRQFGQRQPIVVDKHGVIVMGHTRLKALNSLSMEHVWIEPAMKNGRWLSETECKALRIIDNKTSEYATWDAALLKVEIEELEVELDELDVDLSFFDCDVGHKDGLIDEDEVPTQADEVKTDIKRGDIFILGGKHRVMCGDSTSEEDVALLMDGKKADILFTSPPYNLGDSFKLRGSKKAKESNAYKDYKDNVNNYDEMLNNVMSCFQKTTNAQILNVQMLANCKQDLISFIYSNKNRLVDIITWDKTSAAPVIAEGVLTSRFEWLLVFSDNNSRKIPYSTWRGSVSNVYTAPPQRNNDYSDIHGATFPVHLPTFVISELCDSSSSVADCFMGTGTTLIACEKTNRTCYGMEIDPHYCQVIIDRWKAFTGSDDVKKTVLEPYYNGAK